MNWNQIMSLVDTIKNSKSKKYEVPLLSPTFFQLIQVLNQAAIWTKFLPTPSDLKLHSHTILTTATSQNQNAIL